MRPVAFSVLLGLCCIPAGAEGTPASRRCAASQPVASNAEMSRLFAADQAVRQEPTKIDCAVVGTQDAGRRARTKALLDGGALRSGEDFYHAAFIFQHGGRPDDYLLAHSLAVIAVARGRADATWIAAATLDPYLMSIDRKQIYGTQFQTPKGSPTTQEPYDRALVSDAMRSASGVPVLADHEARRRDIEAMFSKSRPAAK